MINFDERFLNNSVIFSELSLSPLLVYLQHFFFISFRFIAFATSLTLKSDLVL